MKHFWLLLGLSVVLGTTFGWTMNYVSYGHRDAYFGEITYDGSVTAENVMDKLAEYHTESRAVAELQSDPTHDFGAMSPGSKGKHSFIVKNAGDEPLKLELGATTCKCTLGDLESNELAPGESTAVELEWTVSSDKSNFEQSAELRTNDPAQPAIRLTVSGLVISEIEFDPKRVTFGEVTVGEPFEFSTTMYSYFDREIEPMQARFGSADLTELSEVSFEEFEPGEGDGVHSRARQAFRINVDVQPGLRQGALLTNMLVSFKAPTDQDVEQTAGQAAQQTAGADRDAADAAEETYTAATECAGRIVGPLTMLETALLKSIETGGYVWNLGRLEPDDPLSYKALIALKGSQRDNTDLRIGEVSHRDVFEAEIGEPLGKGSMRLFPLTITLKPGTQPIDLLGKNKEDFGLLWIESDNPKVGRMKVAVKVLVEPRP